MTVRIRRYAPMLLFAVVFAPVARGGDLAVEEVFAVGTSAGARIDTRTDDVHWIAAGAVEELYGEAAWTAPSKAGTYALTHDGDRGTWTAKYEVAGPDVEVVGDVDVAADATWSADKTWVVAGTVRVGEGATLAIESGAAVWQVVGGSILSGGGGVSMDGVRLALLDSESVRTPTPGEGARIDTRTDDVHWIAAGTVEELYGEAPWTAPSKAGTYALTHDGDGGTWTAKYEVAGPDVEVVGDVDVAADATWSADKTWVVAGTVRVGEGATLAIESGAAVWQMAGGAILSGGGGVSMDGARVASLDSGAVRTQASGEGAKIDTRTDDVHWIAAGTVEELYGEAAWTAPSKAGRYALTHDGDGGTWTAKYEVVGSGFQVVGDLDVETDTAWGAGKTWLVSGTVVAKPGATLTVESGAEVVFDTAGSLIRDGGNVAAEGAHFSNRVFNGDLSYAGGLAEGVFLDTAAGEVQVAEGPQQITYGTEWGETPADSVTVYCSGPNETQRTLVSASAPAEGEVEWKPESAGGYDLRHVAGEETLTARFIVPDWAGTIVVRGGPIAGNVEWGTDKTILVAGIVTVADGATLTIARGAVVKFMDGAGIVCSAGGTCIADGVVFTHVNDDTIGGDTLADGNIPPVEDQYALLGVQIDETTQCRYHPDPVATLSGTIFANETWRGWNVYCVTGNLAIASGATLTVTPGTVVKFGKDVSLTVASGGTLNAQGTRAQPIVFTSLKDDEHGGDTNGDGEATVAEPGDWKNIKISGEANLAYVSALYGGGASTSSDTGMVTVNSGGALTLDGCTIAHGLFDGVFSYGSVTGENTAIYDCDRGVNTSGGSGVFKNCVIDMCRWGAMSEGGSGTYYNCIITRFHGSSSWPTGWGLAYWSGSLKAYNCCVWSDLDGSSNYRSSPSTANMVLANPLFIDADNGDFRLREESPCVDAGNAEMAPETDQFGQPRVSMAGKAAAAADIGVYEVQPRGVAGNVDLVPTRVSADESVAPGGRLNVRWTVENRGGHSTDASRRDTVSLVSANGRTVTLGDVVVSRSAVAGGTVECTADFIVPAIAEGTWYPKIVANSYQDVFEGSLIANNALTGEMGVEVKVETTAAGEGASGVVSAGVPTVLKLTFAAGDANRMVLMNVPTGTRVTWGVGFVPTAGGASGGISGTADAMDNAVQFVVSEEAENVYVVLEGEETGNFVVTTESAKLAVVGVAPAEIPSSGETTLSISGAGFMSGTAVRLVGSSATIAAESVRVMDSQTISATVDCGKLAAGGVYDVMVELAGENVTATKAVRVAEVPGEAKFWARLVVPDSVREGRKVTCSVEYGNSGNADMRAPVLQVALKGTGTLGYVDGMQGVKTLQFIAAGEAGRAGVLQPGCERRIRFELVAGKSNKMTLHTSVGSDYAPEPWKSAEEYLGDLSAATTRVGLRGRDATDYEEVAELARAMKNGEPTSVICGRIMDEGGGGIKNAVVIFVDTNASSSAMVATDEAGQFISLRLPAGEYSVEVRGIADIDIPETVELDGWEDSSGNSWTLDSSGRVILVVDGVEDGERVTANCFRLEDESGHAPVWMDYRTAEWRGLPDGWYRVEARAGSKVAFGRVVVEGGSSETVQLALTEAGILKGNIDGFVSAEETGIMSISQEGFVWFSEANEDGTWELEGLPGGQYDVYLIGGGSCREGVEVPAGGEVQVELSVTTGRNHGKPTLAIRAGESLWPWSYWGIRDELDRIIARAEGQLSTASIGWPWEECRHNLAKYHSDCEIYDTYLREVEHLRRVQEKVGRSYFAPVAVNIGKSAVDLGATALRIASLRAQAGPVVDTVCSEVIGLVEMVGETAMEVGIGGKRYGYQEAFAEHLIPDLRKWIDGTFTKFTEWNGVWDEMVQKNSMKPFTDKLDGGLTFYAEAVKVKRLIEVNLALKGIAVPGELNTVFSYLDVAASYLKSVNHLLKGVQAWDDGYAAWMNDSRALDVLLDKWKVIEGKFVAAVSQFNQYHVPCPYGESDPEMPYAPPAETKQPQVPQSWDPNEMAGPEGAGEKRYVAPGEWMTYTVYFENKSDATAAAQEVSVTEQLSGALDWGTFEVVDVGFNNQIDLGLGGKRKGASETAMTGTAYKVRTELDFDTKTGAAKWYMRIVDERSETRWPKDVFAGFLPPNDATGRGEGHITYRVKLRDDAAPGTVVRASASIVFDYNSAIETDPAWWNTVAEMGTATVDLGNGVSTNVTGMVGTPWGSQLPVPAERAGWAFAGWWTGKDGTGVRVTSDTPFRSGTTRLHAHWLPLSYTVVFNANGGTGSMPNQSIRRETMVPLSANAFTRNGHAFQGWAKSQNGAVAHADQAVVKNLAAAGGSVTLYAQWAPTHFGIQFNANGGKGTMVPQSIPHGSTARLAANVFTRSGFTFLGWAKTQGGAVAHADQAPVKNLAAAGGNVTLYAVWAKTKYGVQFKANGGKGSMAKQTMTYGKASKLRKNAFKRKGYTFLGWAKTKKGAVAYKNGAAVKNLRTDGKTTALYAKWAKTSYQVAFKANGGTGKMAKQKMTYGKASKLRKNAFKRKGYAFLGWAKTKTGAVVFKNGAKVKNLRTDGKTTTLYAKWKATGKGAKKGLSGRGAEVTTSDGSDGSAVADGDESTGWTPDDAEAGAWVVLTFAKARDVAEVEVVGENLPEGMRVLLSEDAEAWREEVPGLARYVWVAFPDGSGKVVVREIWLNGGE